MMEVMDRYVERIVSIPQNGYICKDYYVKFVTAGKNKFQTFRAKDAKSIDILLSIFFF